MNWRRAGSLGARSLRSPARSGKNSTVERAKSGHSSDRCFMPFALSVCVCVCPIRELHISDNKMLMKLDVDYFADGSAKFAHQLLRSDCRLRKPAGQQTDRQTDRQRDEQTLTIWSRLARRRRRT